MVCTLMFAYIIVGYVLVTCSTIAVNGYIKLWGHMHFFQDTLCQYAVPPTHEYLQY